MTTIGPQAGTCPECGRVVLLVNFRAPTGGYLARHHRPGTRAGTKCRGSFGGWAERQRGGVA